MPIEVRVLNVDVDKILTELGYTREWLDWGIVDRPYLESQYAAFCASDDKHQEHYRCRAFNDFLDRNRHLSDEAIERIFLLEDNGPDGCDLRDNRIFALLGSGVLKDEQHFALAARHPSVLEHPIDRLYKRESLLRKIRRSGLADNLSEIQASKDREIHKFVLEHPELSPVHLQWLRVAGANTAIRNRANALLRSKRFRSP